MIPGLRASNVGPVDGSDTHRAAVARAHLGVAALASRLFAVVALAASLVACGDDARSGDCVADTCPCTGDTCGGEPEVGALGRYTSSVRLADGRLAIATFDATHDDLVVIVQRPGESTRKVLVVAGREGASASGEGDAGRWARIAAEPDGHLQVAWFNAARGTLHWARGTIDGFAAAEHVDGAWSTPRGTHIALAVDLDGHPHLAYRDETNHEVVYAARRGALDTALDGVSTRWETRVIDGCAGEADCPAATGEDFGRGLDLALVQVAGGAPLARIALYDARRGDLKLAGDNGDGTWVTTVVDGRDPLSGADTGDVGRFVSLAVTPTRALGLAYFDATRGALRYLGPGAAPRVVDAGLSTAPNGRVRRLAVGQFALLRYDSQGRAHILHADASTPAVRHTMLSGAGQPVTRTLSLNPGAWFSFEPEGTRLIGAFGAFVNATAPDTRLQIFDIAAEDP